MLFLPDLVIHARRDSFLTGKLQCGTRLTKRKETFQAVDQILQACQLSSVLTSSEYHPGPVASRCSLNRCTGEVPTCQVPSTSSTCSETRNQLSCAYYLSPSWIHQTLWAKHRLLYTNHPSTVHWAGTGTCIFFLPW